MIYKCPVIKVKFGQITKVTESDLPAYTGDYTVTPKTTEQTLETAGKRMTDNIHVQSIPFYEVSNEQGGVSVYIGS